MAFTVDFHEHLVQVPSPVAGFHPGNPPLSDFRCKHRPEPMPPKSNGFVTDIDTPFMEQILDISQRQREPHVQHHRQADDLPAGFKVLEWIAFRHTGTLSSPLPRRKPSSFDMTLFAGRREEENPARPQADRRTFEAEGKGP
jgi:hypothetical protein